jgi:hypothetical protein
MRMRFTTYGITSVSRTTRRSATDMTTWRNSSIGPFWSAGFS